MIETKKNKYLTHRWGTFFFYLPGIVVNSIWGWYPLILGLLVAFYKWPLIKPPHWVGLVNFYQVLEDPILSISIKNTFYYTGLAIGLTFFIPIIVSILLMEMKPKTMRIMMILWFIPIASMASIIIWKYFYDPSYGLFNGLLESLGLPPLGWLNDSSIAMLCIVLPGLIMFAPGLIYLASLQAIPLELYEAAELEGASLWQKIWHVTLPRLRPIISMMLLLAIISHMQAFDSIYVMTAGGPGYATTTLMMRFYVIAFQNMNLGKGGAYAFILFLIIMALVVLQRKYFKENLDV